MKASGQFNNDELSAVRHAVMRKPFQVVAKQFGFSEQLIDKATEILKELIYEDPITPFPDYLEIKKFTADCFLVTTGFCGPSKAKIRGLQLEKDFKEIHIIDPLTTALTKKDVFADILKGITIRRGRW